MNDLYFFWLCGDLKNMLNQFKTNLLKTDLLLVEGVQETFNYTFEVSDCGFVYFATSKCTLQCRNSMPSQHFQYISVLLMISTNSEIYFVCICVYILLVDQAQLSSLCYNEQIALMLMLT